MSETPKPIECDWRYQNSGNVGALISELGLNPLIARILDRRGFCEPSDALSFMNPSLSTMHDPFLMKDMKRAVREVLRAIDSGDRIVIHGDYDVDGTCSVGVLHGFLTDLGADVGYYIPKRNQDGYGLHEATVRRLHDEGTNLLITTDCGVSNVEEIRIARELGMRVIVVDHHTVPEILPPANAILNPWQIDCKFPFKHLAAVGVTFNFVVAIRSELRRRGIFELIPEPDLTRQLDLVALGTVADVMPLVDENRTFVRLGLEVLGGRRRAGISALMDRAAVEMGPITSRTISFKLAPRINAAGRMADASICVELLTTSSYGRATELAEQLEVLNRARQDEERTILAEALAAAEIQVANQRRILVVYGEGWNRGVLGIVASRLMEQFHRPAILMGIEQGVAKGSARGIAGVNLIEVLGEAADLLTTFGGHYSAAGLSIEAQHLPSFHDRLDDALGLMFEGGRPPNPELKIDARATFSELDSRFMEELRLLAPFGAGNPEPILLADRAKPGHVRVVGQRHVRAKFRDATGMVDAFGFGMGHTMGSFADAVSLAFIPREITSHAGKRIEVQLKGMKPSGWKPNSGGESG